MSSQAPLAPGPVPGIVTEPGTAPFERLGYLDGWRGLAILFVLQEHFFRVQGYQSGMLGVDIFFCLSGLLMSNLLFVKRVPLATFYKRRVSRILPAFFLFVLVVYGTAWFMRAPVSGLEFVATLAFLRTYVPSEPGIWNTLVPIGHLWSLNVEEHCYVLLSACTLIAVVRRNAGAVLVALGMVAMTIEILYTRGLVPVPAADYQLRTECAASYVLVSAGYAQLRDRVAPRVRGWMPVAAFALATVMYVRGVPSFISIVMTPFLLAFAVNHLREASQAVRDTLEWAPLRLFGICSYSLYLWQQPFYHFKHHFPLGIALASALLVGAASFFLFENPLRAWLNRRW
jgi:peptidoglycan/LPS O-acetylase OafA/YrhL